ncbi:MAG: hypothetical protein L0Y54_11370 [Sporichthyaceae bacterium]|nr:hypothetical protein [Sporichthyaceae bacterium]
MCDLNHQESQFIVAALAEITQLAEQLRSHARSIGESSYMDHESLAAGLAALGDRTEAARQWVVAKPAEHAAHGH